MGTYFILAIWVIIGFAIILGYENSSINYDYRTDPICAYLNPVWLYENYNVNFFGAFLLMLLFNLICPVVTVIYWPCKFIKWITTVGRKYD
jgi:hypothetical protein